ncbi:MAG: Nif3-like dinuclear metal center hexameric protein [Ignavibacteriales bacterium]|nr:MAG: Nif3-like dinuclear metal center hexameric protein [Ignavibacteriales bacterium]
MTGKELIKYLEEWIPKAVAWQKDNVGLQVGNPARKVSGVLLCLELTEKTLKQALRQRCNFIFSHHPLLFQPLKSINTFNDKNSRLIELLIKNDLTLYSAHTNLDYAKDGVSFELAKTIGLSNIKFLKKLDSNQFKLVVFVPETHIDKVSEAIFNAGGGVIGEYKKCSFSASGSGTFEGSENSNPFTGNAGKFEKVNEIRIEVLVDSWKLKSVIAAMLKNHPYEEPAYDVYPLANENVNYGIGAIGEFEKPLSQKEFLELLEKKLGLQNFRYCSGSNNKIKTVAVCGGSGAEYINTAISANADAYITADVKYHSFQDAEGKILLIDAGHFETEIHSLKKVKKYIDDYLKTINLEIPVYAAKDSSNPIKFYKI